MIEHDAYDRRLLEVAENEGMIDNTGMRRFGYGYDKLDYQAFDRAENEGMFLREVTLSEGVPAKITP